MVSGMGADCTRAWRLPETGADSSRIDIWPSWVTAGSGAAAPWSVVHEAVGLSKEALNNGVAAGRDAASARARNNCRIPYQITSVRAGDWGLGIRDVQNRDWVRLEISLLAVARRARIAFRGAFSRGDGIRDGGAIDSD